MSRAPRGVRLVAWVAAATLAGAAPALAQQRIDEEYTRRIAQTLQDARISTEFVRTMPYSSTVPTPLAVLGSIIGEPGILHHSADIYRYFDALAAASPRVRGASPFSAVGQARFGHVLRQRSDYGSRRALVPPPHSHSQGAARDYD
jgi:hypothetical protein